jgi:iron complex transport system substrate-binding protein
MGNLFVDYLDEVAKGAEDLGSFFEPDVEAVHALQPELIIVGGRSSNQVRSLGRVAPTIDMTIGIDLMTEAVARLRSYGQLFGKETEAASLEAQLKSRVAEARAAAQGKGDALIIMANGPKISAYGVGGRFGWVHEAVGLQEAAPKIGASIHGEAVSFEFIRKTNPDWLIVVDRLAAIGRPGAQAKATLDNALVQQTKAWQSDQVIYLNAADIYIAHGGVQSTLRTLEELIAALNAS